MIDPATAAAAIQGTTQVMQSALQLPPDYNDNRNQGYSVRNYVNTAPLETNIGAILEPYMAGSTVNGGFGLPMQSVFNNLSGRNVNTATNRATDSGFPWGTVAIVGGVVILAMIWRGA